MSFKKKLNFNNKGLLKIKIKIQFKRVIFFKFKN